MIATFARDTVTVLRPAMADERGAAVPDYTRCAETSIAGCSFQPVSSDTAWGDAAQAATVRATLFAPPGADVRRGDLVRFGGETYAVAGAPHLWRSPSGRLGHLQCALIDWRS